MLYYWIGKFCDTIRKTKQCMHANLSPSCLQTTTHVASVNPSSHTVPHVPLYLTSSRPAELALPAFSLTSIAWPVDNAANIRAGDTITSDLTYHVAMLCTAVAACEIKLFWNNFETISMFYFTRNQVIIIIIYFISISKTNDNKTPEQPIDMRMKRTTRLKYSANSCPTSNTNMKHNRTNNT